MTIKKRTGFRGQLGIEFSGIANYTDERSVSGDDVLMFTDKLTELIESLGLEWGGGAKDVDLDSDESEPEPLAVVEGAARLYFGSEKDGRWEVDSYVTFDGSDLPGDFPVTVTVTERKP